MTNEQKEELRRGFEVTWKGRGLASLQDSIFDWHCSKLQELTSQLKEKDEKLSALKIAFDDMYRKADEYYNEKNSLQEQLRAKEEQLKAAEAIINPMLAGDFMVINLPYLSREALHTFKQLTPKK